MYRAAVMQRKFSFNNKKTILFTIIHNMVTSVKFLDSNPVKVQRFRQCRDAALLCRQLLGLFLGMLCMRWHPKKYDSFDKP